jgi:hypothetical protein
MSKIAELLDYLCQRLDEEKYSDKNEITVPKNILCDLTTEVELLLGHPHRRKLSE